MKPIENDAAAEVNGGVAGSTSPGTPTIDPQPIVEYPKYPINPVEPIDTVQP